VAAIKFWQCGQLNVTVCMGSRGRAGHGRWQQFGARGSDLLYSGSRRQRRRCGIHPRREEIAVGGL